MAAPRYLAGQQAGVFLVHAYLGRKTTGDAAHKTHTYDVQCTRCGKHKEIYQDALLNAERKGYKACLKCTTRVRRETREKREGKNTLPPDITALAMNAKWR